MRRNLFEYTCWALIGVAVLLSIYLAVQRHVVESQNKQVDILVEYGEVLKLSDQSGVKVPELLELLREKGTGGVLFKEDTLGVLESRGSILCMPGLELKIDYGFRQLADSIRENYTYILTGDEELAHRLAFHLAIKLRDGIEIQRLQKGEIQLIGVPVSRQELDLLGLGFPEEAMKNIQRAGLRTALQVRNWPGDEVEEIDAFFDRLEPFDISLVLFNDYVIPGGTDPVKISALARNIEKLGASAASIEFNPQQGFTKLGFALEKSVVRLHSITSEEMKEIKQSTALSRFELAVAERNIRALLVRFFLNPEDVNWLQSNLSFIEELENRLSDRGFVLGEAEPFLQIPLSHPRLIIFIIGLGVIAGGVLLLRSRKAERAGLVLGFLALLTWAGILAAGEIALGRKLMALGAAVVFPAWAVLQHTRRKGRGVLESVHLLLRTTVISLAGASMIVGLLAGSSFLVKLEQFEGVKAAFVLPLLIILFFLYFWDKGKWKISARTFLGTQITVGHALAAIVGALVLFAYLSRTGNAGIFVPELELKLRDFLDELLLVRPRTKEFLIGYPFLLLGYYLGYRHRFIPVFLLGAAGQMSLVNTFTHIHTPLFISLIRTFHGLWIGIILGLVLIGLYCLYEKRRRRHLHG